MTKEQPIKHLLMSSLTPPEVGDAWQRGEQLPLHVTVLPWFGGVCIRALTSALQNTCCRFKPLEIVGGEATTLDIPGQLVEVTKLHRSGQLVKLHNEVLSTVGRMGGHIESNWIGQDYTPHVSRLGQLCLAEDESACLDTLELVGKYPDGRKQVETVLHFSGHPNA